jgi:hypothetical protein
VWQQADANPLPPLAGWLGPLSGDSQDDVALAILLLVALHTSLPALKYKAYIPVKALILRRVCQLPTPSFWHKLLHQ